MGASKSAHVLMGENKSGAQGFKFPDKHLNKKPEYFYSALKVTHISSSLSTKIAKNQSAFLIHISTSTDPLPQVQAIRSCVVL